MDFLPAAFVLETHLFMLLISAQKDRSYRSKSGPLSSAPEGLSYMKSTARTAFLTAISSKMIPKLNSA